MFEYSLFLSDLLFYVAEFGLLQGKTGTVCTSTHHIEAGVGNAAQVRVHARKRSRIARPIEFHGSRFGTLERLRLLWLFLYQFWLCRMLKVRVIFESTSEPRANESTCRRRLAILLTIECLRCLLRFLSFLQFFRLFFQFSMLFSHILVLLFEVDELTEEKVAIVLLTCELDLQLLILLLETLVIIINLLCHLCHGFQVLSKLLFSLLEVILIVLFLASLLF